MRDLENDLRKNEKKVFEIANQFRNDDIHFEALASECKTIFEKMAYEIIGRVEREKRRKYISKFFSKEKAFLELLQLDQDYNPVLIKHIDNVLVPLRDRLKPESKEKDFYEHTHQRSEVVAKYCELIDEQIDDHYEYHLGMSEQIVDKIRHLYNVEVDNFFVDLYSAENIRFWLDMKEMANRVLALYRQLRDRERQALDCQSIESCYGKLLLIEKEYLNQYQKIK
jgi:hypothetical protein